MLIYDGDNQVYMDFAVPYTPSEAHLFSTLDQARLKTILVPAASVSQIKNEFELDIPIYPIELLELVELADLTGSHIN